MVDSASVRITEKDSYQPDVLVYCGDKADGKSLEIPNPIIVIEVLSEGTAARDMRDKLAGYFTVPSIQHYLILDPEKNLVIYHRRGQGDEIRTRILTEGTLALDPPGIRFALSDLFA